MGLAEKIATYKQLIRQIEQLEEEKRKISQEIIAEMPDKRFETAEFRAICYQRLSIRPSLDLARHLNATKMEEQIDKEKIKQIFHSGVPIEGVEMRSYLLVSAKNQTEAELIVERV
ncbi:MAG TPA: hypothetical protein VGJ00_01560 [Rhabdochlamydiaceae bacterium]|jgi:hypothetical protein